MALYDQFGREVSPDKRPDDRVLAVASVRDRWSGYPSKGLTPEKLGTIFKEADAGDMYRQMELFEDMEEKDTHIYSILQTRKLSVAGLDFEIEQFSEDSRDVETAEFVAGAVYGLPDFEDNLLDLLDAVGKGYSALELYWELRDGKNVVRHMEWVHPKRFSWWTDPAAPRLLTDAEPSKGMELPPFKFVFHRHKTKSGHPTRQGVMRVCAWMYLFKNYDIKDWVAFAEVYGMPLRLGRYDPSATKEDKDALVQAVRALGSDAAGVISKSTEIEFIEAVKNSGQAVYEALAGFCNAEMSKAVLGQTLTTQQGQSGSYSLGQVHDKVREDLKKADCEMISKTLRRDLIRPLVGFNYGWDAPLPWFRFSYRAQEDLKAEAERYKVLIESGLSVGADHMYDKFGIPKPKDGEMVVSPQPSVAARMKARVRLTNKKTPSPLRGEGEGEGEKDTVDEFTDRALEEADLGPLMEPVEKLLMEAESLEALRDSLIEAYKDMDAVDLGALMERALLAAELSGRFEAKNGG